MERGKRYKFKYFKIITAASLLAFCCSGHVFAENETGFATDAASSSPIKLENPQAMEILTITKHQADPYVIQEIEKSFNIESSYLDNNSSHKTKNGLDELLPYYDSDNEIQVNDFFSPVMEKVQDYTQAPSIKESKSETKELIPLKDILDSELNTIPDTPQNTMLSDDEDEKENVYSALVDDSNVNLEGKTISNITVDGLKYLKEDVVTAVLRTKAGSPFNEELIQQDLQSIYATGYFTDKMEVNPILNEDDTVELVFVVKENLIVNDVAIMGNTVIETEELLQYMKPLKGLPQNIAKINQAIEKITDCYREKGYILGGVLNVDDDTNGLLTFTVTEGVINKFLIEGNEKTKEYVITRNIMTQPGTVYNENTLKEDISKLYATNLFKDVNREIIPVENGEVGQYDIKIAVKEASSNSISIGGGIDSGLGAFGSLNISENNLFGKGQRISLTGLLGSGIILNDASIKNRMNYQVELSFFEPHFLNADNSLMSKLYYRELGSFQVPLAIERRFGGMVAVEHKFKKYKNLSSSMGVGFEGIHLKEGDYNKIASMYARRHIDFAKRQGELSGGSFINFAPSIRYSTLDDYELPRNGLIAQAKFIEALSIDNVHKTNGRIAGRITKYFPVFKKSTISVTGRAGVKVHGDRMPEIMAFSLGGPDSVRGYKMSGVGSGDGFVMGSVELSTPIPFMDRFKYEFLQKIRLNFFVDAGHVFDGTISSKLYDRPMSAISAGVGIKMFIPKIGPISVDYGLPLTNTGMYGPKHGYFTFGTGGYDYYGF